jgi:hypothetical protein
MMSAATPGLASCAALSLPFQGSVKIRFDVWEGSIEHFPPRHDHHVKARGTFATPEDFSRQPLGAVPLNRAAQPAGGRHSEPCPWASVREQEHSHEPTLKTRAVLINPFKIRSTADALRRHQRLGLHVRLFGSAIDFTSTLVSHRQALAPFAAPSLEDEAAVFSCHPHAEPMSLLAAAVVGLKCSLAFHNVRFY